MNKSLQIILFALLATACSEEIDTVEQTCEPNDYSEEELEKIAYGCDYYLDESEDIKVETRATDEYLAYISESLKHAQSSLKAKPIAKYNPREYVGVIKWTTCNQYASIKIHYDSENNKNKNDAYGKTGAWRLANNKKQNVDMFFCRVPFKDFPINAGRYALLRLSAEPLTFNNRENADTYFFRVFMDAEDKRNETSMSIDYRGKEEDPLIVESNVREFVNASSNLTLELIYMDYPHEKEQPQGYSFPDFGFDYGVFGYDLHHGETSEKTGDEKGWIYSDDEDNNNANVIELYRQNKGNPEKVCTIKKMEQHIAEYEPGFVYYRGGDECLSDGIVEYTKQGTKFYISKVNTKAIYY